MLTNEERRVGIYTESHQPIDPAQVSPDTPLEALNLNWRERDLPERVRTKHVHRLHPYLGKFIPQLAEVFLRKFFRPEQTVLYQSRSQSSLIARQALQRLPYPIPTH